MVAAIGFVLISAAFSGCAQLGTDTVLKVGTLMPTTGLLDAYGPDGQSAVQLAAEHVNAANVGFTVEVVANEDDKSVDTAAASAAFERLVSRGAEVIIGSYASSLTNSILDKAVEAGVVVITPASTAAGVSRARDNDGYFFRIPPSDDRQAKVLSNVVWADGVKKVNIITLNNLYGVGFGDSFREHFEAAGGTVGAHLKYAETAATYTSEVQQAGQGDPDAIIVASYVDDGALIMREAYSQGLTDDVKFFFSEGPYSASFPEKAGNDGEGKNILTGFKGTTPADIAAPGGATFNAAFETRFGHAPSLFASQAYDAVLYAALGAIHGGRADADTVREHLRMTANAPGEKVSDPAQALASAKQGDDIDFGGAAHDFDFDEFGDPADGIYSVWQVEEDGNLTTIETNLRP